MSLRRYLAGSLSVAALGMAGGCASAENSPNATASTSPHILALSTYSASLGTSIDVFIANPPPTTAAKIDLVFDGTFTHPDGRTDHISMTQATVRTEAGAARWTTFGPFSNPFTPTNPDIGVFTGNVSVAVTNADGTTTSDGPPAPIRFEVKPSIIVTDLQPTTATCAKPALRLIGALPYKMKVTTIGFSPTSFDYAFTTPSIIPDAAGRPAQDFTTDGKPQSRVTNLSHTLRAGAVVDAIEDAEALYLPPVPDDRENYGVIFAITARDAAGHTLTNTFGMTAHKPLEVYYDGRYQLAQIYPPKPVSGCTPGGQQGRNVDYTEAQTETRQRSLSVTLSKSFLKSDDNNWSTSDGKTVSHGSTQTDGTMQLHGTQNDLSFTSSHSDTQGVSFNWSDGTTHTDGWLQGGNVGVAFKVLGVGADVGGKVEHNSSNATSHTTGGDRSSSSTDGWSQGQSNSTLDQNSVNHSTATTDSTAVTNTNTKGGGTSIQNGTGNAVDDSWTVSSSQTIQRGFNGSVIANTYGVFYRQLARYTERAFVLEYNKCGEGGVVGDVTMQDYIWAPDLALSDKCPPLPESNFPKAQCYLPPCDQ